MNTRLHMIAFILLLASVALASCSSSSQRTASMSDSAKGNRSEAAESRGAVGGGHQSTFGGGSDSGARAPTSVIAGSNSKQSLGNTQDNEAIDSAGTTTRSESQGGPLSDSSGGNARQDDQPLTGGRLNVENNAAAGGDNSTSSGGTIDGPSAGLAMPPTGGRDGKPSEFAGRPNEGQGGPRGGNSMTGASENDEPGSLNLLPGLTAEYFAQYRLPVLQRREQSIDYQWGGDAPNPSVPADYFAVRWTGFLDVSAAGDYTIWANTDDGMRVWVDGHIVIDAWRFQAPQRFQADIALPAGLVPFRVEYMERLFGAVAQVGWARAGMADEILGPDVYRTTGVPTGEASPKVPYVNPVVPYNCPDPGVTQDPETGLFYAICTGGPFHIRRSADLIFWEDTDADVFPMGKPVWAANGFRNWAPEMHRVAGRWVVYYTSVDDADRLCIGAAVSDSPTGPFNDRGAPLVQHPQGVIDAHYFLDDDGRHYLTYKIDGNSVGRATPIYLRELADDGLSFRAGSEQIELLRNDRNTWEGGVVEAQWLVKRDGVYYLFYSGNVYDHRYRTGVARSRSIDGPYEKRGDPILSNNPEWVGPGHGSILTVNGEDLFVYHAWRANDAGTHRQALGRLILVDRIRWEDGWPIIFNGTPSTVPQPSF